MRHLPIVLMALVAGCAVTSRVATTDLPGSAWQLVEMDGEAMAGGPVPTLTFDDRGSVHGSAGCNTFSGSVTIGGSELAFGPLATTRMACADPAANAREGSFLAAMERISGYTVDDAGRLVLEGDSTLIFEVAAAGS